MISCERILRVIKVLLLIALVLPVTSESVTEEPNTGTEAAADPFSPSATHSPGTEAVEGGDIIHDTTPDTRVGHSTEGAAETEDKALATINTETNNESTTLQNFPEERTSTSQQPLTTAGPPPEVATRIVGKPRDTENPDDKSILEEQQRIFTYDYRSLRQWGLICALLLCIIGFLVLLCGRFRGFSCRRRQKRRYNISGL
ncbi:FXYD domain-containing ion transport regulator 5-like isoform X1 [Hyperolius riggenbachi]|uniref:FXYD domain-containing ion transport regulator 5-like isoform X1 n=1 Tax=Hyperolius riggenbachi TaxID=752182 RepID=UPI0035A3191A